jgi:hypothetical protein
LEVAAADLLQRLEDGVDLRGADRAEVGVPGDLDGGPTRVYIED